MGRRTYIKHHPPHCPCALSYINSATVGVGVGNEGEGFGGKVDGGAEGVVRFGGFEG